MRSHNRHSTLKFTSLVVMAACGAVIFGSILFSHNLNRVMRSWGEDIQMAVYLNENIQPEQVENIERIFKSKSEITKYELITQEKALNDFRSQLATYAPDIAQDEDLLKLIPASFSLQFTEDLQGERKIAAMGVLSKELQAVSGVEEISYGQDWLQKYAAVLGAFEKGTWVLGFIIGIATIFVMSNSVGAVVSGRREEIEILEMIGATPSMIRRPFLVEGALVGATSSVLAVLFVGLSFEGIKNFATKEESLRQFTALLSYPHWMSAVAFILCFTLFGALGAYLSVLRINDGWAASRR